MSKLYLMKDKIAYLMRSEGLTTTRFAEILGIQPSAVSHLVSGRNKPGFDLLQKILRRFPRLNPDWLLLDAEEPYRADSLDSTLEEEGQMELPYDRPSVGGGQPSLPSPIDSMPRQRLDKSSIQSYVQGGDGSKNPIFVMVFYDDGSCERFSI